MTKQNIMRMAVFIVCIILLAGAVSVSSNTLISAWIPFAGSGAAALLSGTALWRAWRRLTNSEKILSNYLCHTICTGIVLAAAFYICNYAFANKTKTHNTQVVVEKKYHKVRHHTRRIGRRHYTQGRPYKVYYMTVRFNNGSTKDLSIPLKRYCRIRQGGTISLPVARGLFGVPVIINTTAAR